MYKIKILGLIAVLGIFVLRTEALRSENNGLDHNVEGLEMTDVEVCILP